MASGMVAPQTNGLPQSGLLADPPHDEISDYEKIIRLHDEVRAGSHPRLKIPAAVGNKLAKLSVQAVPANVSRPATADNSGSGPTTTLAPKDPAAVQPNGISKASAIGGPSSLPPADASAPKVDAVPIKKSEGLIKAELRLKRERIEVAMRAQLARQRAEMWQRKFSIDCVDVDMDVPAVLKQALALVKPVPPADDAEEAVKDVVAEEPSYYSSPGSLPASEPAEEGPGAGIEPLGAAAEQESRQRKSSGDQINDSPRSLGREVDTPREDALFSPRLEDVPATEAADEPVTEQAHAGRAPRISRFSPSIASDNVISNPAYVSGVERVEETTEHARPAADWRSKRDAQASEHHEQAEAHGLGFRDRQSPEVPIIRNHIRSPIAPQPARVSPLAVARLPAAAFERSSHAESLARPFSARHSPGSPDEPVHHLHSAKRRRYVDVDDRPRHAARRSAATSPGVYIKQEQTSPVQYETEEDDRLPHAALRMHGRHEPGRVYHRDDSPVLHPNPISHSPLRHDRSYPGTPSTTRMASAMSHEPLDRSHKHRADHHRYATFQASRRPPSPPPPYRVYSPEEVRPTRVTSHHSIYERPVREDVRYYREEPRAFRNQYIRSERSRSPLGHEVYSPSGRSSVALGSAGRAALPRFTIDESGKRYVEGPPPTAAHGRHSIAPPPHHEYALYPGSSSSRARDTASYVEHVQMSARLHHDGRYAEREFVQHHHHHHHAPPPSPPSAYHTMRRVVDDPDRSERRAYRPREYVSRPAEIVEYDYGGGSGGGSMSRGRHARPPPTEYEEVVVPRGYVERGPTSAGTAVGGGVSPRLGGSGGIGNAHHSRYGAAQREYAEPSPISAGSGGGGGGGGQAYAASRRIDVYTPPRAATSSAAAAAAAGGLHDYAVMRTTPLPPDEQEHEHLYHHSAPHHQYHHHSHNRYQQQQQQHHHHHSLHHRREYIQAPAAHTERVTYLAEAAPPPPPLPLQPPPSRRYVDEVRYVDSPGEPPPPPHYHHLPEEGDRWRRASYRY